MKKTIIRVLCLAAFLCFRSILAQTAPTFEVPGASTFADTIITEKRTSIILANKKYNSAVSLKVMRKFVKDFDTVTNVTWQKSKWGYVAEFTLDSVQTLIGYKNTGAWCYTVKKYHETRMLQSIRRLVKSTYYDYNILLVDEVHFPGLDNVENIYYVVLLQQNNHTKKVTITDGEMEEIADFTAP